MDKYNQYGSNIVAAVLSSFVRVGRVPDNGGASLLCFTFITFLVAAVRFEAFDVFLGGGVDDSSCSPSSPKDAVIVLVVVASVPCITSTSILDEFVTPSVVVAVAAAMVLFLDLRSEDVRLVKDVSDDDDDDDDDDGNRSPYSKCASVIPRWRRGWTGFGRSPIEPEMSSCEAIMVKTPFRSNSSINCIMK
jgi:hypothetical protein